MTTDTDERRLDAEFQAHLLGGQPIHYEHDSQVVCNHRRGAYTVPTLDITTAKGQIAAAELLRPLLIPREPTGWWYDNIGNKWAATYPEAIIAAWRSARDAWRESND